MEVRLNSTLRGLCGQRTISVDMAEGATVRDVLDAVVSRLPVLTGELLDNDGCLRPNIIIFINGRDIRFFHGLDTALEPGQTLDIFPRTGGQRALVKE